MYAPNLPIKLQPSEPRSPDEVLAKQQRWMNVDIGELRARWKDIPTTRDVATLVRFYLDQSRLPAGFPENFEVTDFRSGDFNILFKITLQPKTGESQDFLSAYPSQLLVRLGIPTAPYYKVESEVATILFAQANGVPVPRVLFVDSSGKNPLGLDCIFMEIAEGRSVSEACKSARRDIDNPDRLANISDLKFDAVQQATAAMKPLWYHKWQELYYRSIYLEWETGNFYIGPMVDFVFALTGSALRKRPLLPGPFTTVWEYLDVALESWGYARMEQHKTLAKADIATRLCLGRDEAERETEAVVRLAEVVAEKAKDVEAQSSFFRRRLISSLEAFVAPQNKLRKADPNFDNKFRGASMEAALHPRLWHHDCHRGNIMWNTDDSRLTCILDWELVRILPAALTRVRVIFAGGGLPLSQRAWIPKIDKMPCFTILSPAVINPELKTSWVRGERVYPDADAFGRWAPKAHRPEDPVEGFSVLLMALERLASGAGFWTPEEERAASQAVLDFQRETKAMEERAAAARTPVGRLLRLVRSTLWK